MYFTNNNMFLFIFCIDTNMSEKKKKSVYFDYYSTTICKRNTQRTENETGSGQLPPYIIWNAELLQEKSQKSMKMKTFSSIRLYIYIWEPVLGEFWVWYIIVVHEIIIYFYLKSRFQIIYIYYSIRGYLCTFYIYKSINNLARNRIKTNVSSDWKVIVCTFLLHRHLKLSDEIDLWLLFVRLKRSTHITYIYSSNLHRNAPFFMCPQGRDNIASLHLICVIICTT